MAQTIILNIEEEYKDFNKENYLKLIEYTEYLAKTLNDTIKYTEYVCGELEKSMKYSEYLATNIDYVHRYLNLKNDDEFKEYRKMLDENKTEIEIKAFFRKHKIKKILNQ